jgi:hypothetical protein
LFTALLDMDAALAALKKGGGALTQRVARWKDIATHIAQPQIAVSARKYQFIGFHQGSARAH